MAEEKVVRIGAFFDGTGNNHWVDEAMHDGSQTNVAKIRTLYEEKGYIPLYEEGVGTEDYRGKTFSQEQMQAVVNGKDRKDEYGTLGLAIGDGCKMHVERMMERVENEIKDILKENPDQKIVIDVYGFSRGSAEARDFISEINKKYTTLDGKSMVGFVGLFDTVSAIGLANGVEPNYNLNLHKDSAEQIVHIVSQDEHRANFKLTQVTPNDGARNVFEMVLKGVHADIGGGYGVHDGIEKLLVEGSKKYTVVSKSEVQEKVALLQSEAEQRGHGLNHRIIDGGNLLEESNSVLIFSEETVERDVKFGLSNVALNKMYEKMTASGIELPALNILEKDKTTLKDGTEVEFSNYQIPQHIDDSYVHTSSSDEYGKHWVNESKTDNIAYHEQKEVLGMFGKSTERVKFNNVPQQAETQLLNLSRVEKSILLMSNIDTIKVLGNQQEAEKMLEGQYSPRAIDDIAQLLEEKIHGSEIPLTPIYDPHFHRVHLDNKNNTVDDSRWNPVILGKEQGGEINVQTHTLTTQHVYGLEGNDVVTVRGEGNSHVETGKGDDTLIGGKGKDRLEGGSGYDTYKVGNGDVINDIDKSGKIYFDATLLSGIKYNIAPGLYEDKMFIYLQEGNTLTIARKEGDRKSITIENWDSKTKEALGIELIEERNPDIALQNTIEKIEKDEQFLADSTITKQHSEPTDAKVFNHSEEQSTVSPAFDAWLHENINTSQDHGNDRGMEID